MPDDLAYS